MSQKTATIDYEDYEVLLGGALAAVAIAEQHLVQLEGAAREAAEASVLQIRTSAERTMNNVTIGVRAQGFQDRLSAMIANARANNSPS